MTANIAHEYPCQVPLATGMVLLDQVSSERLQIDFIGSLQQSSG